MESQLPSTSRSRTVVVEFNPQSGRVVVIFDGIEVLNTRPPSTPVTLRLWWGATMSAQARCHVSKDGYAQPRLAHRKRLRHTVENLPTSLRP